jgi:lysozyme family protein
MNTNFELCLSHLLQHEGGYVNHPNDPGGRTNLGVTQDVWQDWVDRTVTEEEMRGLTPEKVQPLYKDMYWDRVKGDRLPHGVDYCVFDASVNSGVYRAAKWLQLSVGAAADGAIGDQTIKFALMTNPQMTIDKYCEIRLGFLRGLSTWPTFGKGWERRVREVQKTATDMCKASK